MAKAGWSLRLASVADRLPCCKPLTLRRPLSSLRNDASLSRTTSPPVIAIEDASFYSHHPSADVPSAANSPIFTNVNFTLRQPQAHTKDRSNQQWSVISQNSIARTSFLLILAGQHIVRPPFARKYPALAASSIAPHDAIKYVGFDAERGNKIGGNSLRGAYLSARYESRREETDFSVRDYLRGQTELNGLEREESAADLALLDDIIARLNLGSLVDMPVSNLSNGQTRRARIAKALMDKPRVLLLDGPFMGLDPRAVPSVSETLRALSAQGEPQLVISLRPEDLVPKWITDLIVIDGQRHILTQGDKATVYADRTPEVQSILAETNSPVRNPPSTSAGDQSKHATLPRELGEPVVEMEGVKVSYGDRVVLGDWQTQFDGSNREGLWWTLRRGQACGIFGPNGSGKTTMLSLITSDHPQAYGQPIKTFGRSRLPSPGQRGISLFELQRRMGHSSPEVHAFFPRRLTVRRSLESAWADAPLAKPSLPASGKATVDDFLNAFAAELYSRSSDEEDWATQVRFGELSFPSQRLLLFLRAIIAQPELIILDEAFSGLDETVRQKAFRFLSHGIDGLEASSDDSRSTSNVATGSFAGLTEDQALLVVSHSKRDVPECVRDWICLPDSGQGVPPRTGVLEHSLDADPSGWNQIWDT